MKYRLRLDTSARGMLRPDSNEARKYCGPLLGPQAMCTLSVMYNLVEENAGLVEPTSIELAARVGLTENRLSKTVERLKSFGVVTVKDKTAALTEMVVASWVDPPRAAWRDSHYPPELNEEFSVFVKGVERSRGSIERVHRHQMVWPDGERVSSGKQPVGVEM